MTYEQLYKAYASLPPDFQKMVDTFLAFLKEKERTHLLPEKRGRTPGLAKGLIKMHSTFDDPIEGFEPYT